MQITRHFRSVRATRSLRIFTALALFALSAARASAQPWNITARVNGVATNIGTLTPTFTAGGMTANADLNVNGGPFMDDDCGGQFRWVQIITQDDEPAKKNGVAWGQNAARAIVDVPSGGWDYQNPPNAKGPAGGYGADNAPFYENNDGSTYWFGNYAAYHNETGGANGQGQSSIEDGPGLSKGGDKTTFQTYLVYYMAGSMSYNVLLGYQWTVTASNPPADPNPTLTYGLTAGNPIQNAGGLGVPQANMNLLATAMTNAGFAGWTATTGANLGSPCPEFSTIAMMISGAGGVLLQGRRQLRRKAMVASC